MFRFSFWEDATYRSGGRVGGGHLVLSGRLGLGGVCGAHWSLLVGCVEKRERTTADILHLIDNMANDLLL